MKHFSKMLTEQVVHFAFCFIFTNKTYALLLMFEICCIFSTFFDSHQPDGTLCNFRATKTVVRRFRTTILS